MIDIKYEDIVTSELSSNAIVNDAMSGFKEDYLILHCLIKKYKVKSIFEIGTNVGRGTKIIKNAIGDGIVISLDLPDSLSSQSKQSPKSEGNGKVGHLCNLPYIQVFGDSMSYDYSQHLPIDAFFIDGEHDFKHPYSEAKSAILCEAKLIVFHDADMHDVFNAISDAFSWTNNYKLYKVINTRIAYAIRNSNSNI